MVLRPRRVLECRNTWSAVVLGKAGPAGCEQYVEEPVLSLPTLARLLQKHHGQLWAGLKGT